jgi:TP901-1 family phage major tail protein
MSQGVSGVDFIVKVNTGTEAVPVYTAVGGQRGGTLNGGTDEIDVSSKDSNGWKESLAGLKNWSLEFDSLLIESDAGLVALETAWLAGEKVQVQLATPAGATYTGPAIVTDFSYEAPHDGEATAKGTLTGAGALAKVAA